MAVITGAAIPVYRMVTLLKGSELEALGMRRSGPSCLSIIKKEFNLKGSRKKVHIEFEKLIKIEKHKIGV
jgi:hypothetical protein